MASGTMALVRTGSGYLTGQILWSSVSNGPAANTSTVTATLQIQRSALNATTGTFKGTFTVGDVSESLSWYGTLPTYEWVTIKTITTTVSHNTDGNGSCYLYAIVNGPTGTTMEGTYVSGSSTVALDWIPRFASIISATDFTDEENPTITYSNPAGTAVDALTACISITGAADDVNYRDVPKTETEYTFHLTEAERNTLRAAIPNSQTGKFQFHLATTMDDVWEHPYVYGTMRIVNANPTIAPSVVDTNSATKALTGNPAILVALHSKASVTIGASAKKYATIASQRVEHGTAVLTGNGTLSVTNNPIKFTVTDSRGFTTTQYAANTIIPYIDPTCEIGNNMPEADGSFALVVSGLFYNGSFGAKANSLTVQYRYKTAVGSYGNWVTFDSVSKNGDSYTATANLTGLDYQTTYVVQARVMDALHTSGVYASEKAVIAKPVFDWGQNDFLFNVPVIFTSPTNAYAPDGYGLGKSQLIAWTDLDNVFLNGWYRFRGTDFTIQGVTYNAGYVHVCGWDTNNCEQTLYPVSSHNEVLRRHRNSSSVWTEWEWDNPPMALGVEYRTTERYLGKVVYTKLIAFGAMPANTLKTVSSGLDSISTAEIIYIDGFVKGADGTTTTFSTADSIGYNSNFDKSITINTSYAFPNYTATVLIKYTK